MSACLHERETDIKTTKKSWSKIIHDHNLKTVTKDYTVNDFTTRLCYLSTENFTVRGAGKGRDPAEIDISASYEAIEYYLSGYSFNPYPTVVGCSSEISNHYKLRLERCNAEVFNAETNRHIPLPWVIYHDIKTNQQHAAPLASVDLSYRSFLLENDHFDYDKCDLYAASNGLASGATYEESIIHGALELLERDAYSYFLIDTYILKIPPLVVDKQTLPENLTSLILKIEKNYHNQIIILRMPSRFGVYVYAATFFNKEFGFQARGCGASLNAKHALERAVYELVQIYNLMHGHYLENQIDINKIKNNLLIKKIIEFNLADVTMANYQNFHDNSAEIKKLTLADYLERLVNLIYGQASSLLINVAYKNANGLTCSRVIIPEAEEFFLATHYLQLKPKNKTDLYITDQLGKKFDWHDFINKEKQNG